MFSTSCVDIRTGTLPGLLKEEEEESGENDKSKPAQGDKSEFWKEFQRLKRNVHHNADASVGPAAGHPVENNVSSSNPSLAVAATVPKTVDFAPTSSATMVATPVSVTLVSGPPVSKSESGSVRFVTSTPRTQQSGPAHVTTMVVDGVVRKLEDELRCVDSFPEQSDSSVHSEPPSFGSLSRPSPQPSSAGSARVLINTVSSFQSYFIVLQTMYNTRFPSI